MCDFKCIFRVMLLFVSKQVYFCDSAVCSQTNYYSERDWQGWLVCYTCTAGYYCDGTNRYQCIAGSSFSSAGATACTPCSSTGVCAAGTYYNPCTTTTNRACTPCIAGSDGNC